MQKGTRLALAALAVTALSTTGRAQESSALAASSPALTATASATASASIAGPRADVLRSGVALAPAESRAVAERAAPAPLQRAPSQRAKTLMIVGGAALLGGAIIGDDAGTIIMLGGLGVGLYGLWLYLQ